MNVDEGYNAARQSMVAVDHTKHVDCTTQYNGITRKRTTRYVAVALLFVSRLFRLLLDVFCFTAGSRLTQLPSL